MLDQRALLLRLFKYFSVTILIVVIVVLVDFSIDIRPSTIQSSYQFTLRNIPYDQPQILQQDNLSILLIKRSKLIINVLQQEENLQDPLSKQSSQPRFADNSLRSRHSEFFVSYGNGTDLGCLVEQKAESILGEICGKAEYDFAGRALKAKNQFQNLSIPDYNFSDDFKTLTIRP